MEISHCDSFDDDLTKILSSKFCLESLTIVNCSKLTNPAFSSPTIKHLAIRRCSNIQTPVVECKKLESLELSFSTGFSDEVVSKIFSFSNNIKSANLRNLILKSPKIQSDSLKFLKIAKCKQLEEPIIQCPNLVELDLSFTKITDKSIGTISETNRSIRLLNLKGCRELVAPTITSHSLESMHLDYCAKLKAPVLLCPKLNDLTLSYTKVTDNAFDEIFLGCPQLRKLAATKCDELQSPKIRSTSLEQLDFHGCHNIQEPTFKSPKLKKLVLNWTKVDDQMVEQIAKDCVQLDSLSVKICDQLVNPIITSKSIEDLEFSGAHNLQSPIIKCEKLKKVDFTNCESLDSPIVGDKRFEFDEDENVSRVLIF